MNSVETVNDETNNVETKDDEANSVETSNSFDVVIQSAKEKTDQAKAIANRMIECIHDIQMFHGRQHSLPALLLQADRV